MATKKRPQTPNRGAADIIGQVIRKVKRMLNDADLNGHWQACDYLTALHNWLRDWDERAAKKRGGLGKQ